MTCKLIQHALTLVVLVAGCVSASAAPPKAVIEAAITTADRSHWSFQPLKRPAVPKGTGWCESSIDRFIEAKFRSHKLGPAPFANRRVLIRRLSFNLLGLPPTAQQVNRFLQDRSPDAYEQLVDRMLGSPRFGERWAQYWLDLARFADTEGFEFDKVRPRAWRYRDWVINALNQDMAYDRFLTLQLAGDEMQPAVRVATGFCVSGPDMPDINSQEERRHHVLNEITSTVASALLGLQFGCAQCHDHKYDPISQADFYRLRAFFEPSVQLRRYRSLTPLRESKSYRPQSFLMVRGDWRRKGPPLKPAFPRIIQAKSVRIVDKPGKSTGRRIQLARWLTRPDHPLTARIIVNRVWQHHFGHGLFRTPSDVGEMGEEPSHPQLLDWLASELIHSGWSLKHIHRLIVTSATYRQASFPEPSNKNWLARSLKMDPVNEWLSRFPRRRLQGEVVRDAMLAVSDSLNLKQRGPGVMPPLPQVMIKTLLRNQWKTTRDRTEHQRRSVYLFARRNLRYPLFEAFDRPDANASCPRRRKTTTATQSLLLLNSDFSLTCAKRLAKVCQSDDKGRAVGLVYQRLFARAATSQERQIGQAFLKSGTLTNYCLALLNTNEFIYID